MSDPNVSVIMCDDLRIEMNGKVFIIGMYPNNIVIPNEEVVCPQLQFFFAADFDKGDIPTTLAYEVELPGEKPQRAEVPVFIPAFEEGHTRWLSRYALTLATPKLRTGKIDARVITEKGVFSAVAGWIAVFQPPTEVVTEPTA
jgi:hypothetical protein